MGGEEVRCRFTQVVKPVRVLSPFLLCPEEGSGEVATFYFSTCFGDPRECRGYVAIPPTCGPPEGRGEATTSDFVTFFGDPREFKGYVAPPSTCGPPRRQG